MRDERAEHPESLGFADVGQRAIEHMGIQVEQVNWFSTYRVHHRVAQQFRRHRAFLLGDAAHVHSPAGGQGMNTGIGDAINLAWKLASVLHGKAGDELLDSYEIERKAFAERLVATTDQVFNFVSANGRIANLLRTRLAPVLLSRLVAMGKVRSFMFRTVSQIGLNYRLMPLSFGSAGHVHGGDRLPWAHDETGDNFAELARPCWQVHVYGLAGKDLTGWCAARQIPLQVFAWSPAHEAAGLARNAFYLIRPDSYVALAEPSSSTAALERYFTERSLRPC